jgi:cobalt transporter subunit CbtA
MYFRNLVLSAITIALVASLFLSLYQYFLITPIIVASEIYEVIEPAVAGTIEAWEPQQGMQRTSFSFGANFLLCFAYSLLLISAIASRQAVKLTQGLFWGIAAYLSIFVAPALGLAPEIPGMEAAYLEGRQTWWLFTVLSTSLALGLIVFKLPILKGIGGLLIVMPHWIGAPQPDVHGFVNADPLAQNILIALWHDFILHTSLANALLWLIIGCLSALLTVKFIYPLDYQE